MIYKYATIEELVADDYFRQWVKCPTQESVLFWQTFLANHPEQAETVRLAADAVRSLSAATAALSEPASKLEKAAIWNTISTHVLATKAQRPFPFLSRHTTLGRHWFSGAASILVVLGLGWWGQRTYSTTNHVPGNQPVAIRALAAYIDQRNTTDRPQLVALADGSSILLQNGSRLRYPRQFTGNKRVVHLVGEAYFEVAKDADRPFLVYTSSLITKVLGTSFTIKAYNTDPDVIVTVRTGRVAVFAQSDEQKAQKADSPTLDGVVLTRNQQLVFPRQQVRLTPPKEITPAVAQRVFALDPASFQFEARPVSEVIALLEKVYAIEVVYDKETLGKCRLTADLTDEPLADKMMIICKSIEATYTMTGTRLTISGPGCGS